MGILPRPAGRRFVPAAAALAIALAVSAPAAAQQSPITIPGPLDGPLPRYSGAPATARPLPGPYPMANPALAPDGRSGTGLAAANGAASPVAGPLGHGTVRKSALQFGTCGSIAFDQGDRIVAVCSGPLGPTLRLVDPQTMGTIGTLSLPIRPSADRTDVGGGTHFVQRADGSLLVPTNDGSLIDVLPDAKGLHKFGSRSLRGLLRDGERPFAVGGGFDGREWVVGNKGSVLTIPRDGGSPGALFLGEPIAEDIATDPTGTYVVTRDALYRLQLGTDRQPRVVWREPIPSAPSDPMAGRIHPGSGTPPVLVAGGYVAVADGRNPPRVRVVRIEGSDAERLRCAVPVFDSGAGSVESHLVVAGRSIVVANTWGYDSLLRTEGGRTSKGGLARVVVGRRGCRVAWRSAEVAPTAQAVVSRSTGLYYTLTKPKGFPDAWNLTAIDWRTGETRFAALAGEGLGYNSEGGPVVLGPGGAVYAGTFGGLVRFRDGG